MMARCCLPIQVMLEMIVVLSEPRFGKVRPPNPIAEASTMGGSAEHANFCLSAKGFGFICG
jgi:hypothetical protein